MLLSKYKVFLQEITSEIGTNLGDVESIAFFRKWNDTWFDGAEVKLNDKVLIAELEGIPPKQEIWRRRGSRTIYFQIPTFFSVVVVTFQRAPRAAKRSTYDKKVKLCLDRSQKAFDAAHDKLTGLLNASSFNDLTIAALNSMTTPEAAAEFVEVGQSHSKSVAIIALDIDHFKQVNDTYGHVYGDKVLTALGRRLETCAQEISEDVSIVIDQIHVSRPSGEEFLILVSGDLDIDGFKKIGEIIRTSVNQRQLPSDEEWSLVSSATDGNDTLQLPPSSERNISVSIGIASVGSKKSLPLSDPVQALRSRADKALYCAKAGGRNTVRHYDEILNVYGKVLEHQEVVDIVIIDIGKEVNVQKGQEFIVYHPNYTGIVPYIFDDGRTRRALGMCPRISIGRIIAFEIAQEISFCKIEEKKCNGPFLSGCNLEAVPLGSISHLFSGNDLHVEHEYHLSTFVEASNRCKVAVDGAIPVMVAVFTLANEEILIRDRGSSFINKCLAKIYQGIQEEFPDDVYVFKVKETEFGVVLITSNSEIMQNASINTVNLF